MHVPDVGCRGRRRRVTVGDPRGHAGDNAVDVAILHRVVGNSARTAGLTRDQVAGFGRAASASRRRRVVELEVGKGRGIVEDLD